MTKIELVPGLASFRTHGHVHHVSETNMGCSNFGPGTLLALDPIVGQGSDKEKVLE